MIKIWTSTNNLTFNISVFPFVLPIRRCIHIFHQHKLNLPSDDSFGLYFGQFWALCYPKIALIATCRKSPWNRKSEVFTKFMYSVRAEFLANRISHLTAFLLLLLLLLRNCHSSSILTNVKILIRKVLGGMATQLIEMPEKMRKKAVRSNYMAHVIC